MSERVTPGPICGDVPIREAVCTHTKKVFQDTRELILGLNGDKSTILYWNHHIVWSFHIPLCIAHL